MDIGFTNILLIYHWYIFNLELHMFYFFLIVKYFFG
jgi:hypothetical protein